LIGKGGGHEEAVIGIVRNKSEAESIIEQLLAEGFSNNDISVLLPNTSTSRDFAHTKSTKAPEGAIAGVGAGGLIGGTVGLLAGVGTLAIPGLGPFIAAGPILMALSGVAAGASLGGIAFRESLELVALFELGVGDDIALQRAKCGEKLRRVDVQQRSRMSTS
jgi:hypothetical protein